jgi:hypothetical protein
MQVLVGKCGGKTPHGRSMRRWYKVDLVGIKWQGVSWIYIGQDRDMWRAFVHMIMNLLVPYNARYLLNTWGAVRFSRITNVLY